MASMPGTWPVYLVHAQSVWYMASMCLIHGWHVSGTWPVCVWYMHGHYMCDTWPIMNGWYMTSMCLVHDQNVWYMKRMSGSHEQYV